MPSKLRIVFMVLAGICAVMVGWFAASEEWLTSLFFLILATVLWFTPEITAYLRQTRRR